MDPVHPRFTRGVAFLMIAAIAGCASPPKPHSDAVVSVSAINYAQVAAAAGDVMGTATGAANISPELPTVPKANQPVFYLMVPGEIYPSDVPMDAVYRQLRISLERRGYYNAVPTLVRRGRPLQVDYLLRLHYGVRPWGTPTVRTDQVTWGDNGLVAKRYQVHLASNNEFDPRTGLDQDEVNGLLGLNLALQGAAGIGGTAAGHSSAPPPSIASANFAVDARTFNQGIGNALTSADMTHAAHPFCLVVLEAFRFTDVKVMDRKAPCVWMIFIAVPVDHGEKLSSLLPAMLKTAEPYYGGTTQGLQVFEVPQGKVEVGEPEEVKPKASDPDRSPSPLRQ